MHAFARCLASPGSAAGTNLPTALRATLSHRPVSRGGVRLNVLCVVGEPQIETHQRLVDPIVDWVTPLLMWPQKRP